MTNMNLKFKKQDNFLAKQDNFLAAMEFLDCIHVVTQFLSIAAEANLSLLGNNKKQSKCL